MVKYLFLLLMIVLVKSTGIIKLTVYPDMDAEINYKIIAADGETEINTVNRITIFDNDAPELSVNAVNPTITEADNVTADFLITTQFSPHRELEVRYNLTESHNFIDFEGTGETELDFTNGKTEARISIPINNDTQTETDGTITLTIRSDDSNPITYTPALSPNNSATVNIEDDESLPLITISAPITPVVESAGMVNFVVSATTDLGDDVRVRFDPSEVGSGDFLTTNQEAISSEEIDFTGSGDSYTATLSVPIHDDGVGERTGQIEVTLLEDDALDKTYRVATDGTQVATATILDDNAPELAITAGSPVTEDGNTTANFIITSQVPVTSLTLNYTPESTFVEATESGQQTSTPNPLTFSGNGPYTATLPVTVHNDDVKESDGTIRVTLNEESTPASTYTVKSSPSNTAEITVYDDDSPFKIWITADNGEVSESAGTAMFEISATGLTAMDVTSPLTIYATPTQDGSDYLPDTVPTSFPVTFTDSDGDSTYTGELSVTLDDDSNGEATSDLTLTLNADTTNSPATYQLSSVTEGVITIKDDDAPVLSIGDGTAVTEAEGLMAMFPITASFNPDPDPDDNMITIYYTPTQSGTFLDNSLTAGSTTSSTLDFGSGTTATLEVPIANDEDPEVNGSITISLVDDENTDINNELDITYTIDPSADNTGTVDITDDDSLPVISITADNGEVFENAGPALFMLSATGLTTDTMLSINATPSGLNSANFLTSSVEGEAADFDVQFTDPDNDDTYTGQLSLTLDDDGVGEVTGDLQVVLNVDPDSTKTYRLGSETTGVITVYDEDAPELKISAGSPVIEGDGNTADFTITSQVPVTTLDIDYTPVSASFLGANLTGMKVSGHTLTFTGNGPYTAPLPITVHDDGIPESNGTISITLNDETVPATTYTVAPSPDNTASVDVTDDDSIPTLSITAPTTAIVETAGSVNFVISATNDPGTNFRVRLDPSEVGSGDFLNESATPTSQEAEIEPNLDFSGTPGNYTATLPVPIHDDTDIGERTGQIEVTILDDDATEKTYLVATDGTQSARATILDNDAPELKITAGDPVTEGDGNTANFTITSQVPVTSLTINYTPESTNFIESGSGQPISTPNPIDFSGVGPYTATLPITVHNDGNAESDGTISVTLNEETVPATTYTVASAPDNSASVNVTDDESLPILTITAPTTPIAESDGEVDFVIHATTDLGNDFRVRYDPSEVASGDFLNEAATPTSQEVATAAEVDFTGSADSYTATLSVPIHDDEVGERTGQIEVTLLGDDARSQTYQVATDGTQAAMATILDEDAPELTVSAGNPVTEDDNVMANFTITSQVPVVSLTINYTPESASFVESGSGQPTTTPNPLIFSGAGPYTATLPISVHNDEDEENDGIISVTLNEESTPATTYTVKSAPSNTAEITVYDDDSPNTVWIATDSGEVAESEGTADFKVFATGLTEDDTLTIYATPSEDGDDFLTDAIADTMDFYTVAFIDPDGDSTYSGVYSVTLDNDNNGEASGDIKLTLNSDSAETTTYQLGTTTEGVITILDDDAPELSISAGSPVTEAQNVTADFTISAAVSPNDYITIRYDLAESHDFISNEGTGKLTRIDFRNDAKDATLSIPIANDTKVEENGTITVTLTADNANPITYNVATSPDNEAEVSVSDDDIPEILMSADSGDVAENAGPAKFILTTTDLTTDTTLMINATPAEDGADYLANDVQGNPKDFPVEFTDLDNDGTYTGELSVELDNDDNSEATGDIKVTLNADMASPATYRLGSNTEGVITVWDNNAPELKITAGSPITETDNLSASFVISAEVSPNDTIMINYDLAESGNFIDNEGDDKMASLNFSNNATEVTLPIEITSDSDIEDNGTITVTLTADTVTQIKYTVAPSPDDTAEVTVYDDDSPPSVLITTDSGNVAESEGTAGFNLTATGLTADTTLMINATPAEDGSNYLRTAIEGRSDIFSVAFTDEDGDNTYEGVLSIPLDDDEIGETTGTIKLTLNAAPGSIDPYRLGSTTEGTITIWDDDAPELKIVAGNQVTEAENTSADFVISAEVSPNQTISVLYNLTESQDFIEGEGTLKSTSLDFSNDATEATLSIPITSDAEVEDDGSITVTLTPDNADTLAYTLASSPNHFAIINVVDDDVPVVEIDADSGGIAESNGTAPFKLSATGLTANTTLTIRATPNENGHDFLSNEIANNAADYMVQFTDADNDGIYRGEISVRLHDDGLGERTGDIKLTLHANPTSYQLGSTTEGAFTIWDDDAPELAISAGNPITEDDNIMANFTITSQVPVTTPLTLNYTPTSANFIETGSGQPTSTTNPITFDGAGPYTATLPIAVHNDIVEESDGMISVTLNEESTPATSYTLKASPDNTADVTIYDDDSPKTVTIAADSGEIFEDEGPAKFKLSATGLTGSQMLTIQATPAEDGSGSDFLPETNSTNFPVMFTDEDGDNTFSGDLSVPLDDDGDGEASGQIKLTLNADTSTPTASYRLGSTTEGFITILDDDLPELSIGDGSTITEAEGAMAMFPITASFNPNPDPDTNMITVYYTPTQSGDFLGTTLSAGTTTSSTLNFASGTSAMLAVPITNDESSESDGSITITLAEDQNTVNGQLVKTYIVDASPDNVGTIAIEDDDSLPTISIVANNGITKEISGQAQFELSATGLAARFNYNYKCNPKRCSWCKLPNLECRRNHR